MAKLHYVKRALKTYRGTGIKKGQPYWHYKHYRGPKVRCKNQPPRSAYLTTSPFVKAMMNLEDRTEELKSNTDKDYAVDELRSIADEVREVGETCREGHENMSGNFPNGCPTLDLMQSRIEACETIASKLDDAADELENYADCDGEMTSRVEFISSLSISWEYE